MWSGWRSSAPTLPSPASGGGGCYALFDAEALERHIQVAQVEGRVEELRQLVGGESLAHLRDLAAVQVPDVSSVVCAASGPLDDAVGIVRAAVAVEQRAGGGLQ